MFKAFERYEYEMLNQTEKLVENFRSIWLFGILAAVFLIMDYLFLILWLKNQKHARFGFFVLTMVHLLVETLFVAQYFYDSHGNYATVLTPVIILIFIWTAGVDTFLFWVMKKERQKGISQQKNKIPDGVM